MKKTILLLLVLPTLVMAQKIKMKKDRILVDEKEIGILNDKVRDQYILSDLTGAKQLTVEYKTLMEGQNIINQWLVVTSADGSQSTQIPYEVLITAFSPTKITLHLLAAKYNLFDSNGFNQEKIAGFFAVERPDIGDKSIKAKTEVLANRKERDAKVGRYNPFVKTDGMVIFGGGGSTNIVGKVIGSPYTAFSKNNTASVYDLDGELVAFAQITDNANNEVNVEVYNDSKFTYASSKRYSNVDNSGFFKELISELVFRDITLGHQAKAYKASLRAEKTKLAKERSRNLYNVKGYAIDNKGVKHEGIINAQFEMLDINQTGNTEVVDAIDKYGKNVTIKYLNEKGKERSITLSAKDNVTFWVNNADGTQTGYEGMKVNGDAAKKISNAMSLGFNNAYFYKVLHTDKGNSVLVDPVEDDRFVIKLKGKDAGQMIDKRNNKNLSAELAEYVAACPALAKEIKAGAFDLKIEENLVNIVKEFNDCK